MRPSVDALAAHDDEWVTNALLTDPGSYAALAKDASPGARQRLTRLVEDLWPSEGLRAGVTRDGLRWTIKRPVLVVLYLGPVLDIPLDTQRWLEVASSGFALSDQTAWLRRHYSSAAGKEACSLTFVDVRTWAELLDGVHESPEVEELLSVISTTPLVMFDGDEYLLSRIGSRIAAASRVDLLECLSAQQDVFRELLEPDLAVAGDTAAASNLLTGLATTIRAGGDFDSLDHRWMDTICDPALLPEVFTCIEAALANPGDGFGLSRLCGVVRRIGTVAAIECYDALIASSPDPRYKFLRPTRDEILADLLQLRGQAAAKGVSEVLALPFLA
jgi:hypothetical protein